MKNPRRISHTPYHSKCERWFHYYLPAFFPEKSKTQFKVEYVHEFVPLICIIMFDLIFIHFLKQKLPFFRLPLEIASSEFKKELASKIIVDYVRFVNEIFVEKSGQQSQETKLK